MKARFATECHNVVAPNDITCNATAVRMNRGLWLVWTICSKMNLTSVQSTMEGQPQPKYQTESRMLYEFGETGE